jgi:hypothetical protein
MIKSFILDQSSLAALSCVAAGSQRDTLPKTGVALGSLQLDFAALDQLAGLFIEMQSDLFSQ